MRFEALLVKRAMPASEPPVKPEDHYFVTFGKRTLENMPLQARNCND